MRLWHQYLIPHLPNQQLMGQHRECCALRGKGWGRRHSTVDYVFTSPFSYLLQYHNLIIQECASRNVYVDSKWLNPLYRGKDLGYTSIPNSGKRKDNPLLTAIYQEHNKAYLVECIDNLKEKGNPDLYYTLYKSYASTLPLPNNLKHKIKEMGFHTVRNNIYTRIVALPNLSFQVLDELGERVIRVSNEYGNYVATLPNLYAVATYMNNRLELCIPTKEEYNKYISNEIILIRSR